MKPSCGCLWNSAGVVLCPKCTKDLADAQAREARRHRYFLRIAYSVASLSKDPRTKVGAVVVKDGRIVSTGYNGHPAGMPETDADWTPETKYDTVIHAELNALLYAHQPLGGATLYTTLYPCLQCAKAIAAARINLVVYNDDKHFDEKAEQLLAKCGIEVVQVVEIED